MGSSRNGISAAKCQTGAAHLEMKAGCLQRAAQVLCNLVSGHDEDKLRLL